MVSQVVLSWVAIVYAWLNCGKLILPPSMNYCWLSRYPHLMVNISPQSFSIFSECLSDQVATESSNGQQSAPAAGRRRDIGFPIKSRGFSKNIGISLYPYAPWCWYIYLQNWVARIPGYPRVLISIGWQKGWIQHFSPWSSYCSRFFNSGFTVPCIPGPGSLAGGLGPQKPSKAKPKLDHVPILKAQGRNTATRFWNVGQFVRFSNAETHWGCTNKIGDCISLVLQQHSTWNSWTKWTTTDHHTYNIHWSIAHPCTSHHFKSAKFNPNHKPNEGPRQSPRSLVGYLRSVRQRTRSREMEDPIAFVYMACCMWRRVVLQLWRVEFWFGCPPVTWKQFLGL